MGVSPVGGVQGLAQWQTPEAQLSGAGRVNHGGAGHGDADGGDDGDDA